mmetsp:Transcript_11235/g.30053  ORF Transcript_11235/g.30053 Transcript_11235/m.30053 type:complete len:82 (-) Transcript_11235:10-255(-)
MGAQVPAGAAFGVHLARRVGKVGGASPATLALGMVRSSNKAQMNAQMNVRALLGCSEAPSWQQTFGPEGQSDHCFLSVGFQ